MEESTALTGASVGEAMAGVQSRVLSGAEDAPACFFAFQLNAPCHPTEHEPQRQRWWR